MTVMALALAAFILIPAAESWATINSLVFTPPNTTRLSDGRDYFLAGKTYDFVIWAKDPDATSWASIDVLTLTIVNSTNLTVTIDPDGIDNAGPVPATTGTANVSWAYSGTSTHNDFTITISVTFLWTTEASAWTAYSAAHYVRAYVHSTLPAANSRTDTVQMSYGVCSSIKLLDFKLEGEAADGMINPYHEAFNVTGGEIVYNVSGASSSDAVRLRADAGNAEVTGTTLTFTNGGTYSGNDADLNITNGLTYAIGDSIGFTNSATAYTTTLTVNMATGGATETVTNTLSLRCDEIEITDIIFMNGGGVDGAPSNYYRSLLVTGTQVRVNARLFMAGTPVVGDTIIVLRDTTDGTLTSVTVLNGQAYGVGTLTMAGITVAGGSTGLRQYEVYNVHGGSYCSVSGSGQYRNSSAFISHQPALLRAIYWDNGDAPGADSYPFNGTATYSPDGVEDASSSTSQSFRIRWDTLSMAAPGGDFYSYIIYYREQGAPVWNKVDRDTYTADGRYYHTPVPGADDLGNAATSSASVVGLKALTVYEFRLSAVDVFSNEVADPNRSIVQTATTGPLTVTVQLTDGITTYGDATFTDNLASTKPVVRSAITVIATIQGDTLPTSVNLIAAGDGAAEVNNDILDASVTREIFAGMDISGNRWKFVIPTTSSLLTVGTSVRFVLEVNQTSTSHVDHTPATDHTDNEFRFYVSSAPAFTPWPTRILNNVITDKNPVAYPSYYLSDDANVTIKVYDIKGRPVAILLDGAFRKGGQNIKENGWRGHNKSNKMMGVGLYYVHFQAKRASDNKVILDQIKKVVIAK